MNENKQLRQVGLRATHPRIKILSLFRTTKDRHLNAEEVYLHLIGQKFDIGLATVYRALLQMEEVGLLRRSSFSHNKAVVFELNETAHHDHLVCLSCGRTEEFNDAKIEERQQAIATNFGYKLTDHQLALYGYCEKCVESLPPDTTLHDS